MKSEIEKRTVLMGEDLKYWRFLSWVSPRIHYFQRGIILYSASSLVFHLSDLQKTREMSKETRHLKILFEIVRAALLRYLQGAMSVKTKQGSGHFLECCVVL